MRRIRLTTRTLFIVALLTSLLAVWWVTWPGRTIDRFQRLMKNNEFDQLLELVATEDDREIISFLERVYEQERRDNVTFEPNAPLPGLGTQDRSVMDLILGRAFYFRMDAGICVQHGQVSFSEFAGHP